MKTIYAKNYPSQSCHSNYLYDSCTIHVLSCNHFVFCTQSSGLRPEMKDYHRA